MRISTIPGLRASALAGTGFTSTTTAGTAIVGTNSTNGLSMGVPNFITTAMASDAGTRFVQASAGFNGTNCSGTIASNSISISVGNYITTAMLSNRGSDFVQATAGFNGTNCSGTIASNAVSVSIGNYLTTAMASNRGTDFVQATAGFNGTNISGTIASNSVSMSVAGPYTASRTVIPTPNALTFLSALGTSMGQGSLSVQYMPLACYVSASRVGAFVTVSVASNAASTGQIGISAWLGVYSLSGSTLSLASSQSTTYAQSWSSNTTGSVHGPRRVSMAMNMNGTPGEWWCGIVMSTSSANLGNTVAMAGGLIIGSNNFADFSVASTVTMGQPFGLGIYSTTTNGVPASIALSEISQTGTNAQRANIVLEFANTAVW